jgi:hypothetical protein
MTVTAQLYCGLPGGQQVKPHWMIFLLITIMCGACGGAKQIQSDPGAKHVKTPDYSNLYYWAAHPDKYDYSDSTPEPFKNYAKDTGVDVFFIHPTNYLDYTAIDENLLSNADEKIKWNADIDDTAININTDKNSMLFQASAFNHYRVFAPRYRQAHYQSFFIADSLSKPFFDTAYADIKKAFRYYLVHYNHGRPFIIASHSQGTLHAGRLIRDTIENTALLKQLVAAYIIGMPVPQNYFSKCLPCSTATQTHCFVSWRTFKTNYVPPFVEKERFKAIVVNPLTWTTDTTFASKKLNRGAVLFNFNKPKEQAVSAVIHNNILWSSKPHFFGSILYTKKNYHVGDINLFWKNIRDNVDDRVEAYKKLNNGTL